MRLKDGTAAFEFQAAWNSKVIRVEWDPTGPIALLDAEVAALMLRSDYARHPNDQMVADYNALIEQQTKEPELPLQWETKASVPPVAETPFPPDDWLPHPTTAGYYYKGQTVLTEQQLREQIATQQ